MTSTTETTRTERRTPPMPIPCEQAETISRIGNKIDRIHDIVADLALQNHRITTLEISARDHEDRIRSVEKVPLRVLLWTAGLVGAVISAFFTVKILN